MMSKKLFAYAIIALSFGYLADTVHAMSDTGEGAATGGVIRNTARSGKDATLNVTGKAANVATLGAAGRRNRRYNRRGAMNNRQSYPGNKRYANRRSGNRVTTSPSRRSSQSR